MSFIASLLYKYCRDPIAFMAGVGDMVGSLSGIFQMLPMIFSLMQPLIYVLAILFFGSIAVLGYRGYLTGVKHFLLRLLLGAICVVTGTSIAPLLRIENPLLKLAQLDTFAGMLSSSVILLFSMRLMTLNVPYSTVLREKIRRLQEKLERRQDKDAKIPENRIKNPATIIGLIIFIGFIAFSLFNFHGFPDMQQSIFSALGISESDMNKISQAMSQYACVSVVQEVGKNESLMANYNQYVYTNPNTKSMIERGSNDTVSEMYRLESNGKVLIISALSSGRKCYSTETEICTCTYSETTL